MITWDNVKACVADRAICLDQWAPEGYLSKRNTELDLWSRPFVFAVQSSHKKQSQPLLQL